ncbi:MAG: PTS sugar transporter subunit IIC [Elusimicrobia bacterium]|nr:PTS sugar transporter subunit IIC [Elusimicrobiota bacterium]
MTETGMIAAGFFYAVAALDHIAVGQFMISRPLVVGPLLGWYLGNAPLGLLAGAVVELLWMQPIPMGIRPVDTSIVAALTVVWSLTSSRPGHAVMALSLMLAIPCGMVVRRLDVWSRRQNSRFLPWVAKEIKQGQEGVLTKVVLLAVGYLFVKAFVLFVVFGFAGRFLINAVLSACPPRLYESISFAGRVLPLIGFCAALNYFYERSKAHFSWGHRP